jgi:phosphatidylserine/phosphatidylglycerophosphate/cardiolipin synthase-like enzyme
MFQNHKKRTLDVDNLVKSKLYDQNGFYKAFIKDLNKAKSRVIIESPFLTKKRVTFLSPTIAKMVNKHVKVIVNTKPLNEQSPELYNQAYWSIAELQGLGVIVLFTTGHHRKLAIVDDEILWEGSLNILSQNNSCELMRRIVSINTVKKAIHFTGVRRWC